MSATAILIGLILLYVGFYVYIDTFENSTRYSASQGSVLIALSALTAAGGGLLALFAYAGLRGFPFTPAFW